MYYIKNGLPKILAPLSLLYAAAAVPAVFCSGNLTQTGAAVQSFGQSALIKLVGGIFFAVITALVLSGIALPAYDLRNYWGQFQPPARRLFNDY